MPDPAPDANEFCLVLTPTPGAPARASEAIRQRFEVLADEIRRDLAALIGELVEDSVERRPRKPITVTVSKGGDIQQDILMLGSALQRSESFGAEDYATPAPVPR